MPKGFHLLADISPHGFGHLAITAPVLMALDDLLPGYRLTVRSALPEAMLRRRIRRPFEWISEATDFGYAMLDAMRIDWSASARAYQAAHTQWRQRVEGDAGWIGRRRPDVVVSSVSYLPLAGARLAGVPGFALCSLNWADLFAHYFAGHAWAAAIHAEMLEAYRGAAGFLRVTPGMAMPDLANLIPIAPVATLGRPHDLGLGRGRAVLVAMGGIAHHLPLDDWPRLPGVRWLVPAAWHCRHPDAIAAESLGLAFPDLLCSVDAVITKPGYGTFSEAACNGTPVLYQRRDNWPEQDCLIAWLHDHARAASVPGAALIQGAVGEALDALWSQTAPSRPLPTGARQAAEILRAAGSRSA